MLVQRIAAGPCLGKAGQLRELLFYLGRRAILAPGEDTTEQQIGVHALGRRPDYDPQADNIVRVQIRRLRQKLDEYFAAEGHDEPLVISIPKGGHILRFERRPARISAENQAAGALPWTGTPNWWWIAVAVVGLLAVAFFMGRATAPEPVAVSTAPTGIQLNPMWSRVFVKDQPTAIVIADSSFVILQNLLQEDFTLNEYVDRTYRDRIERVQNLGVRDALRMIAGRQYTSLADATLSSQLNSIGTQMGARMNVRYSRHMNVRDFHAGNFILIGSSHGVPWAELFAPALNFKFERIGPDQRFGFRNLKPATNEAAVYSSSGLGGGPQQSFATISLVPNLARNGSVLLLNGITMEATEAAGEFAMGGEFQKVLHQISNGSEHLPHFEVLLKSTAMAGAPDKVSVVTWRRLAN